MSRAAENVFSSAFQLVLPDECRVCGEPLQKISRIPVCYRCLKESVPLTAEFFCVDCRTPFLNRFPLDESGRCTLCRLGASGFDAAYSYGAYDGALRKLIHLFKYGGVRPLARTFGKFLASALPLEQRYDLIVPMPLHWHRRWQRGFNQAGLLAREISKRRRVPARNVARRIRATAPQAGLTSAKRRVNVGGAFSVKRGAKLEGMRVLLVDDVMTTGASASACARALKKAGAKYVAVLALARADRRDTLIMRPQLSDAVAAAGAGTGNT